VDTSEARATAAGDPSCVGSSVTCDRTDATAVAATITATIVAPIHAAVNFNPVLMNTSVTDSAATGLTHG